MRKLLLLAALLVVAAIANVVATAAAAEPAQAGPAVVETVTVAAAPAAGIVPPVRIRPNGTNTGWACSTPNVWIPYYGGTRLYCSAFTLTWWIVYPGYQ